MQQATILPSYDNVSLQWPFIASSPQSFILVISGSTCKRRAKGGRNTAHRRGEGRGDVGPSMSRFLRLLFFLKMAVLGCREVALRTFCGV